jgi:Kelch motif.
VGGFDGSTGLNSAEMYDPRTHEWRMIAPMSTRRSSVGVGVVNGLLYAVSYYCVMAMAFLVLDLLVCFCGFYCHSEREVCNAITCRIHCLIFAPFSNCCLRTVSEYNPG